MQPGKRTLYLLWPERSRQASPSVEVPAGYLMRPYVEGREREYLHLLSDDKFRPDDDYLNRTLELALPNGLFFVVHAATGRLAATACALHNPRGGHHYFPFGGELGNVVVHPAHRRRGLGRAVCAAAITRFLAAGYESVRVGTQDHRLPALRLYLALGFVPFLYAPDMRGRWRTVCENLGWPFTPLAWPTGPYV